ncbi:YceD family protein [Legionella yabuuchiae]|uniref:YceD family protein n=1 Tax=Legionella yabuuchiae TaxID=376727 RepID=UPI00105543A3|nr:YceD family protein [Legionella yabuuchiae]
MKIFLPKFAKEQALQDVELKIKERLPTHVEGPCTIHCDLSARVYEEGYYLLTLKIKANIVLVCQRCLQTFPYEYKNQVEIAVCDNEQTAEKLMSHYECIVSPNYQLDIIEVLTDDLHLNLPEKHLELVKCDLEMLAIIGERS